MKKEEYRIFEDVVVIPVPESYKDCIELIRSDKFRKTGRRYSALHIILSIIRHPFGSILSWFRLSKLDSPVAFIFRSFYNYCCVRRCIHLPYETRVGYGFFIGHDCCFVINEGSIIGGNVNISQFVNIGSNHNTPCIIGNNVYIGPNVSIVEDVKIGSETTIGAGAVVCKDLMPGCTAVGVPAKPVNFENRARYIGNRWLV